MSADETMTVSSTGGQKAGNDERYDLIPAEPLRLLAKHYGVGAKKYDDNNWRKGYDWKLSFAALNRHLWAFWSGEEIDAETGTPHIIAVAWHAFTLAEFSKTHPEFDNRLKTLDARAIREPDKLAEPSWLDAVLKDTLDWYQSLLGLPPMLPDEPKPEPREVPVLAGGGSELIDAVWRDGFGNLWRWNDELDPTAAVRFKWEFAHESVSRIDSFWIHHEPTKEYGPYVEALDYVE